MNISTNIKLFVSILLFGFGSSINGQDYRTIDGSNNNANHPEWGAAHTPLVRIASVGYSDGISAPGGTSRPNPRAISNALFSQNNILSDPLELSDYVWVFGQFIDHEVTFVLDGEEPALIDVPTGDFAFDPLGTGSVQITMNRSRPIEGTGTSRANPRNHANIITSYIDGSAIYGSDDERADWLRSFSEGKLKVSERNLLPFNTTDGEFESPIDENAPHMDNPVGLTDKFFVAGDDRANENPLLLAFHTLFVLEHNRICDEILAFNSNLSDEIVYQTARKILGALLQNIVYNEWLPAMGVKLPEYRGYNPNINPGISNEFSAAAFRLGHTLLNGNILRLDENGESLPDGHLSLRFSFFNPLLTYEDGIEPYFQGMAAQIQQSMDAKVVDDVRNFLFGPPGAGGLDLASINIARGRERGLADFNTIREDLGLDPYVFFIQISAIPEVFTAMRDVYQTVNTIDPWVGMLAEAPMPNALFGETIMKIMEQQFLALRDGDRFYFENDPSLIEELKNEIRNTHLVDIIKRNTGISLMQENVFKATLPNEICGTTDIQGIVHTEDYKVIEDVLIRLSDTNSDEVLTGTSNDEGIFSFEQIDGCRNYDARATRTADDWINGVTTLDLLLLQKHLLGTATLDSPYKLIAADANGSGTITVADLVEIQKVILGMKPRFAVGASWRFIAGDYEFNNPNDPFKEDFENLMAQSAGSRSFDIIGVKVGDLNNSSITNNNAVSTESRAANEVEIEVAGSKVGNLAIIDLSIAETDLAGMQFGLDWHPSVQLKNWKLGNLANLSTNNFNFTTEGVQFSWINTDQLLSETKQLVRLVFEVTEDVALNELIALSKHGIQAEAYVPDVAGLRLNVSENTPLSVELLQNRPNPFADRTEIQFYLPTAQQASLSFYDLEGKLLYETNQAFEAGLNTYTVERTSLGAVADQVITYKLKVGQDVVSKQMLLVSK